MFFGHLQLGAAGAIRRFDWSMTASSARSELDGAILTIAAASALALLYLALRILRPAPFPGSRLLAIAAALLFLGGIPQALSGGPQDLGRNPAFSIAADLFRRPPGLPTSGGPALALTGEIDRETRLPAFADGPGRRPNVVLISLESVGGLQLLDKSGLPRQEATPNLARLARSAAVFPNVYTIFPGTTRSLVYLHAGGRAITWGGDYELWRDYNGPTLGREFQARGYRTALFFERASG